MLLTVNTPRFASTAEPRYHTAWANDLSAVREAQALRYRVFKEEMGATLTTAEHDRDVDHFDRYADHLLVRDNGAGTVVGCYRVLRADAARAAGGFYAETEFDLRSFNPHDLNAAEAGRACIDPAHRNGGVIMMLWAGLADYMLNGHCDYLFGCASISLADGGGNAAAVCAAAERTALAPEEYRVRPRNAFPWRNVSARAPAAMPPLLKGYLRLGAWVCGDPAWDPEFNTADLMVLLPRQRIRADYARHFFGRQIAN